MGLRESSTPDGASDRINIVVGWELNYWSNRWGVGHDELIKAVAEVGPNLRVVQAYLQRGAGGSATPGASSPNPAFAQAAPEV